MRGTIVKFYIDNREIKIYNIIVKIFRKGS